MSSAATTKVTKGFLFQIILRMRDEMIKLLLELGAEDLTKEMHPDKVGKRYLKIEVAKGSYIDFNFDYKEYKDVFVFSKRRNINKQIPISQINDFLFNYISKLTK